MMSASAGHSGDDGACNCGQPHRRDMQHRGELRGEWRRTLSAAPSSETVAKASGMISFVEVATRRHRSSKFAKSKS